MDADPAYREVQRFRQWWIWTLLGSIALLVLVLGPVSVVGLALVGTIAAVVYSIRLTTEVRNDGIYIKMWPLHQTFRRISWSEIERYEVKTYNPIREFGGWGIRWAPGEMAYNVSGNRGVWIQCKNGRTILIGSQRAEDFIRAIDEKYTNY